MLYMVVERFNTPGGTDVYRRAREKGRLLPQGLEYVSSWVDSQRTICFQLMKTEDPKLLTQWTNRWEDLVDFEIFEVEESKLA